MAILTPIILNRLIKHKFAKRIRLAVENGLKDNPERAYWYARDVLERRFELGEPAIAKSEIRSYLYARGMLGMSHEAAENWGKNYED